MPELQEVYFGFEKSDYRNTIAVSEEDSSGVPLAFKLVLLVQHVS